jgi:hypothetical protein
LVKEAAMSNNVVLGFVLAVLVLFGLRGVLPEVFATVHLPMLIALAVAAIAGYVIGRYTSRRASQGHS